MKKALAACLLLAASACVSAAQPASEASVVEAFMWEYTRVWNTHDAARIAERFYRTGPSVPEQTASLERSFGNLRAQGYVKSTIHEIRACMTGEDTAWAGMKFSRLKADGEPLPPKDRSSSYDLKKFADGWRIVKLGSRDADKPLACAVAPAS